MKSIEITSYINRAYHIDTSTLLNRCRNYLESLYTLYDESPLINYLYASEATPDATFTQIRDALVKDVHHVINSHGIVMDPDTPLYILTATIETLLLSGEDIGDILEDSETSSDEKLAAVILNTGTWLDGQQPTVSAVHQHIFMVSDSFISALNQLARGEAIVITDPPIVNTRLLRAWVDEMGAGIIDELAFQIGVQIPLAAKYYIGLAEDMLIDAGAKDAALAFIGFHLMAGVEIKQVNDLARASLTQYYGDDPILLETLHMVDTLKWKQIYE